jgi:hypothetical protein
MAKTKTHRWMKRGVYSEWELTQRASRLRRDGDTILADSLISLVRGLHCNDCQVLIEIPMHRYANALATEQAAVMHELGCESSV